ncbi:MAG: hypothetical protein ABSB95_11620 [Dissulfurispiraceae bacterium]|jgi:hypothetical protein
MRIWIILIISMMPISSAFAFDVEGLRPLPPYGVFSTFSTESLQQNTVGICLGFERSADPNFYRATAQLAYGIHDRFEIDVTLPYDFNLENHVPGLEDANFGVKHRILDEGQYYPAVAYILTVSTPSGGEDYSTHGHHGAGLLITKKIGPFKGDLNIVYDKPNESDLKEQYNVNLGAELAITHDSKFLAELVGRKEYFTNRIDLLEWRLGYRIATLDNLYTTLGAGFNMRNESPTPKYRLLFSVSYIFPKKKKGLEKIYEE